MIRIFILLALIGTVCTDGFTQRIFYNSEQVTQPYVGPAIRTVRVNWRLSPNVTVVYNDGHWERVARRAIWGYENDQKHIFRYYRGSFYQIVNAGERVRYSLPELAHNGALIENPYFSRTLDSRIRPTKNRTRRDTARL